MKQENVNLIRHGYLRKFYDGIAAPGERNCVNPFATLFRGALMRRSDGFLNVLRDRKGECVSGSAFFG